MVYWYDPSHSKKHWYDPSCFTIKLYNLGLCMQDVRWKSFAFGEKFITKIINLLDN